MFTDVEHYAKYIQKSIIIFLIYNPGRHHTFKKNNSYPMAAISWQQALSLHTVLGKTGSD